MLKTFVKLSLILATIAAFPMDGVREKSAAILRTPASGGCTACDELKSLRAQILRPASPEQELALLKQGGLRITELFQSGTPDSAQIRAATEFLVFTLDRDGADIALDWIATGLGTATEAALREFENEAKSLQTEKAITSVQAKAFAARLQLLRNSFRGGQDEAR